MKKLRLGSMVAAWLLVACSSGSSSSDRRDGAAGAGDLQAPNTSLGGAGGTARLDAFAFADDGAASGLGGAGGMTGAGGGTHDSGGGVGAGGRIAGSGGGVGAGGVAGGSGGAGASGSGGRDSSVALDGGGFEVGPGTGGLGTGGLGTGGLGTGGANGIDSALDSGGLDGGSSEGTGGPNCGFIQVATSQMPADVLLVLDRSGSMSYSIDEDCNCPPSSSPPVCASSSPCTSRWPAMAAAVDTTLNSASAIQWGLKFFTSPTGGTCTVNPGVEVPISAASVPIIEAQIANAVLANSTPTAAAITAATAYLQTVADANPKAMVLATDGDPNCGGGSPNVADTSGTLVAIDAARSAGFPVYVIGIGPSVSNLDAFAQVGGTNNYYPATSTQALADALKAISGAVTTCTFLLDQLPPDANNLAVYLDKSLVPEDSGNGWSFGASEQAIVLNGSFCAAVRSGTASLVQALFGCPGGGTPPPTLP
jgi:hypothetical protein